jgi:hypothetical protein
MRGMTPHIPKWTPTLGVGKRRNPNIGFVTKCEVQGPMRPRMCLGVKQTLTNGEECKG